jgi:hypothetical protein
VSTLAPPPAITPAHLAVAHPEWMARMVKVDTDDGPVPMDLWAHQVEIIRAVLDGTRVMVLKARQLGVSWVLALIALWWAIAKPAQTVMLVSIGEREAASLMRKVRRLYDSLPASVRAAYPLVTDTVTRIQISHDDGASTIFSVPSSPNAGSGETVHLLIGDERTKWPYPVEQEASLFPAAALATIVLVGTAQGMDTFYDRWVAENGWTKIFVGALARPDRTVEWVESERDDLGDLGPQEYPLTAEEAFLASGRCAFDMGALAWTEGNSCEPAPWRGIIRRDAGGVVAEAREDGHWRVWEQPQPGRDYAIVADASSGHGADYSAASVIDLASWDEVAALHGKLEPAELAREIYDAGHLWRGVRPALLVPEANNHGQGVIALLREWGYPRIYATEVLDQREKKTSTTYGWTTNEKSRPIAIAALQRALREHTLGIRDRDAIVEMRRFIWVVVNAETGTGRYQAESGYNDDRVMTWAIAAAVLAYATASTTRAEPEVLMPYEPHVSSVTGY